MGETRTICIPRTARYAVVGDLEAELRELWFVLHGYGQLADDFAREFSELERPGRVIVAPEGLSRFYLQDGNGPVGASWMTKVARQDEIDDYVRYLDAIAGEVLGVSSLPEVRVRVLGYSQGAATACRWALSGRTRVDHLILWAGGIPPDVDFDTARARLDGLDLTFVVGTRDAFVTPDRLEREVDRLRVAGIPHRLMQFDGGHRLDRDTLRRLAEDSETSDR